MTINTDGGSRGNPGPGACGVVIKDQRGNVIKEQGKYLGVCTNNEAEYQGLILGMKLALELKAEEVEFRLDSELVVKQLKGQFRVKEPRLARLFMHAKELESRIGRVSYFSVPREKNKEADAVVNRVLDKHQNE